MTHTHAPGLRTKICGGNLGGGGSGHGNRAETGMNTRCGWVAMGGGGVHAEAAEAWLGLGERRGRGAAKSALPACRRVQATAAFPGGTCQSIPMHGTGDQSGLGLCVRHACCGARALGYVFTALCVHLHCLRRRCAEVARAWRHGPE